MIGISVYGVYNSKYNKSVEDYFLGSANSSWWVAMLSIVATETSVLTFISIPSLSYRGDWSFLQLAMGYILGRILVAVFLLPLYFKGKIISIYEVIGERFGIGVQRMASSLFLITRLLADGIRFFAIGTVVQVITGWPIWMSILIIGCITMVYTLSGGIRTVIMIDALQFILYLIGGITIIMYIVYSNNYMNLDLLISSGKLDIFQLSTNDLFFDPWYFWSAFFGGVILSVASHGADYMMVQRVLTCINLKSARKAMVGSGFFVFIQFSIFLIAGSLIWIYLDGVAIDKDRELSTFIVNHLPAGIRGLLLAGVLSAAMSTLSSSINSLASSTINDWLKSISILRDWFEISVRSSFIVSLFWAFLLIVIALMFDGYAKDSPIVIIGYQIASFTYGGLLSLFLLALSNKKFSSISLILGLLMSFLAVYVLRSFGVAWTWYIGASVLVNLSIVYGLYFFNRKINFINMLLSLILISSLFGNDRYNYKSGLDILVEGKFASLKDKRIGLVINHTSIDKNSTHIIESAFREGIVIQSIFTPEHGFVGLASAGELIEDGFEKLTGAPIYSLYGENKKPNKEMLNDIDLLLFDMQDIGVRYYTYMSTLTLVMESAAENQIKLVLLDRLNPLGRKISGPILKNKYKSFVGMHTIPVSHGMSLGELSSMINGESWLRDGLVADLEIIKYYGNVELVDRVNAFDPKPSPNMSNLETALLYQGLCLLEGTNISEGRGTDYPFQIIGAPWIDNEKLYHELLQFKESEDIYELIEFIPISSPSAKYPKYEGEKCKGLRVMHLSAPIKWTVKLLDVVYRLHPDKFRFLESNFIDKLYGEPYLRKAILENYDLALMFDQWIESEKQFDLLRQQYLLYD